MAKAKAKSIPNACPECNANVELVPIDGDEYLCPTCNAVVEVVVKSQKQLADVEAKVREFAKCYNKLIEFGMTGQHVVPCHRLKLMDVRIGAFMSYRKDHGIDDAGRKLEKLFLELTAW